MIRALLNSAKRQARRFTRNEDGSAAFDFVIVFPLYMMLFLGAFETGMVMVRQVMLDRGLDMSIRVVRLNTLDPPDYEEFKTMVCSGTALLPNCNSALKLEMRRFDPRVSFNVQSRAPCVDRKEQIQEPGNFETGGENEMIFVRACVKYKPFFPTATLGGTMTDTFGEYALVAMSVFVTEPT